MAANFDIPGMKTHREKYAFLRRISTTLTYVILAYAVFLGSTPSCALDLEALASVGQPEGFLRALEGYRAAIWGPIDVLGPGANH